MYFVCLMDLLDCVDEACVCVVLTNVMRCDEVVGVWRRSGIIRI